MGPMCFWVARDQTMEMYGKFLRDVCRIVHFLGLVNVYNPCKWVRK